MLVVVIAPYIVQGRSDQVIHMIACEYAWEKCHGGVPWGYLWLIKPTLLRPTASNSLSI